MGIMDKVQINISVVNFERLNKIFLTWQSRGYLADQDINFVIGKLLQIAEEKLKTTKKVGKQ